MRALQAAPCEGKSMLSAFRAGFGVSGTVLETGNLLPVVRCLHGGGPGMAGEPEGSEGQTNEQWGEEPQAAERQPA